MTEKVQKNIPEIKIDSKIVEKPKKSLSLQLFLENKNLDNNLLIDAYILI